MCSPRFLLSYFHPSHGNPLLCFLLLCVFSDSLNKSFFDGKVKESKGDALNSGRLQTNTELTSSLSEAEGLAEDLGR